MNRYKDLIVWQKAMELVVLVYAFVKNLPREELYGLSDQMRRAVVSVPSNIAEGYMRGSKKEFSHFLTIAMGSCAELETQIELCKRLGFCSDTIKIDDMITEILKMATVLNNKLQSEVNNK